MAVALEQFVKELADSGVIAPGKLENFIPPKAAPKDAQELAEQLVQSKHLTSFQVEEICAGRAKSLILGNYTILDRIGAGGMGQVFKAEHRRMHRLVAIKMLPDGRTKDAAAAARFQREVEAAAKLNHPNIVAAYDSDEAGGVHFLVMEYVEGSDLSALVKKNGPLPVAQAVNYVLQAARGLEFAHGEGVVHRDIKPANLLLDKKGVVKILDMGLARIDGDGDTAAQTELTGSGAVLGSVDFMAPEQALDTKHADARADIYGLGCSLYYLLAGHAAYAGNTLMARLLAHREAPIPSLGIAVPEQIQAVFQKMIAKKVQDRYQTTSELIAALERCKSGQLASARIQQTVDQNFDCDTLTFLSDTPLDGLHGRKEARTTAKARSTKTGNGKKKLVLGAVGTGFLGLAILAGLIFKLRTKDGTLVVEVNEPDSTVQVLDADGKIEVSKSGGKGTVSVAIDPGKHRLKVQKDGFKSFAEDFEMDSGGEKSLKATLVEDKPWFDPDFLEWQAKVAGLPADRQVAAVVKKLQQLNPAFDGKETHEIDHGVVTQLQFFTDNVTDISPVRALVGLQSLICPGTEDGKGLLSDLSPLRGMRLTKLNAGSSRVSDLSPIKGMRLDWFSCGGTSTADISVLKGMPLTFLSCGSNRVTDFSPLKGMPLKYFDCGNDQVSDLSQLKGLPLENVSFENTQISDLSPLEGMALTDLRFEDCKVSDLSPLAGMPLSRFNFTPRNITKGIEVIREMRTLTLIGLGWGDRPRFAPDEFWKKYDAGEFGKQDSVASDAYQKPVATFREPAFEQWTQDVAAMPAEQQVQAVVKKLQELNPSFDGIETHKIEDGAVTELQFLTNDVTDISPVRALKGLKALRCQGTGARTSIFSDLSPLQGMRLTQLDAGYSKVFDLSPLKGMPLTKLLCGSAQESDLTPLRGMQLTDFRCENTKVADLSPLKGMPLELLFCDNTSVSDLSPLEGMPLRQLDCGRSHISDLSPLKGLPLDVLTCEEMPISDLSPLAGMNLTMIYFTPKNVTKGIDAIRQMKTLTTIGLGWGDQPHFKPEEFWKKYDAGEFGKPASEAASPDRL